MTIEPSRKRAVATLRRKYGEDYFSMLAKKRHEKERAARRAGETKKETPR